MGAQAGAQALQAEADAEEALATLPASLAPAGHMWLGRARLAQGNWAEAASAFRAALQIIGAPTLPCPRAARSAHWVFMMCGCAVACHIAARSLCLCHPLPI